MDLPTIHQRPIHRRCTCAICSYNNGYSLVNIINRDRHTAMKNKPLISEEEFNKRHDKALKDSDPSYMKNTKPKPKKDIFKGLGSKSIT